MQRISDATSRLLAQGIPLETLTTSQIATEADVAVGSLYRFFADKQSIVDDIAVQRLADFQRILMETITPVFATSSGEVLLEIVIDRFVSFLDENPDFRTLAYGGKFISRGTREEHSGMDAGGISFIKHYMVDMLGIGSLEDIEIRLRVAVEAGDRLIGFAFEQDDTQKRKKIIDEMKHLLTGYLFSPSTV